VKTFGDVGKDPGKQTYAYGFDSQTGEYVNLVTKGIIDPTKSVRLPRSRTQPRLAALLITTEAMSPSCQEGGSGPANASGRRMGGMYF